MERSSRTSLSERFWVYFQTKKPDFPTVLARRPALFPSTELKVIFPYPSPCARCRSANPLVRVPGGCRVPRSVCCWNEPGNPPARWRTLPLPVTALPTCTCSMTRCPRWTPTCNIAPCPSQHFPLCQSQYLPEIAHLRQSADFL